MEFNYLTREKFKHCKAFILRQMSPLHVTDLYRRIRERLDGKHPKKLPVKTEENNKRMVDEITQCHIEDWKNWVLSLF